MAAREVVLCVLTTGLEVRADAEVAACVFELLRLELLELLELEVLEELELLDRELELEDPAAEELALEEPALLEMLDDPAATRALPLAGHVKSNTGLPLTGPTPTNPKLGLGSVGTAS